MILSRTQVHDTYPKWVCARCATGAGAQLIVAEPPWKLGLCEVCVSHQTVTLTEYYGYPDFHRVRVEDIHGPQGHHP